MKARVTSLGPPWERRTVFCGECVRYMHMILSSLLQCDMAAPHQKDHDHVSTQTRVCGRDRACRRAIEPPAPPSTCHLASRRLPAAAATFVAAAVAPLRTQKNRRTKIVRGRNAPPSRQRARAFYCVRTVELPVHDSETVASASTDTSISCSNISCVGFDS